MTLSITNVIIGLTCLSSYLALNNRQLFDALKHYPYQESRDGSYFRWLSSGFLHGDFGHLFINMFVLFQFGNYVESLYIDLFGGIWGRNLFLLMYLFTIIAADIPTYIKHKDNPYFSSIGASGATSGIVLIYCLVQPWQMFIFPPVPAVIFAVLYIAYSSYSSNQAKAKGGGIDHDAHLWGALFGLGITIALKPSLVGYFIDQLVNGFPF